MVIFFGLPVVAEDLNFFFKFTAVGHDRAGFAESAEVFSRVETEATGEADGARFFGFVLRAMGLTGILNYGEAVFLRYIQNWIHISGLAIEMDGDNGAGAGRDGPLQEVRVHGAGLVLNINKHGGGPAKANRFGGGDEGIGDGDDFVSRPNAEGEQGEPQGIAAVADADGIGGLAESG